MLDIESYLVSHDGETECGENLEYDPLMLEAREALEGKPAQQIGDEVIEAVEPDWKQVKKNCLEIAQKSHSLEALTSLTQALMQLEGYAGLMQGAALLEAVISNYWGCLHPQLDPDDNDPIERLNMLAVFSDFTFLRSLRKIDIIQSQGVGAVSVSDIRAVKASNADEEAPEKDAALISAIFQSSSDDDKEKVNTALEKTILSFQNITQFLQNEATVGTAQAPTFEELIKQLNEAKAAVSEYLNHSAEPPTEQLPESTQVAPQMTATTQTQNTVAAPSGAVNNRQDVIRMIEKIEDYYHQNEPGSPIPILLSRAKNLVNKDFLELMQDLSPDSLHQLEQILGTSQSDDYD